MQNSKSLYLSFLFCVVFLALIYSTGCKKKKTLKPCMNLQFYYHDILYLGSDVENATSVLIAKPPDTANFSLQFGYMVIFDDPITLDSNMHSPQVGRAQGLYVYNGKHIQGAWFGFTIVLNSTDYKGSLTIAGADYPLDDKHRYFSVVGGTGDFLMARGVCTITTDEVEPITYFRLLMNITLYECYT
ncbi:dirigent protein 5 [Cryptomeria japonica]|uniref:dirigent protein 5 n=1 Tax=Cryptomeria japonica TaxID=3369 RepID=UPI0027DA9EA7|nr:dirigent protein 5 [Cryptomeria japonica]